MKLDLSPPIYLLGVRVDRPTWHQLLPQIVRSIEQKQKLFAVTPNPEIVLRASEDPEYREVLNHADVAIPDGFGLVVISYILWLKNVIRRSMVSDLLRIFPSQNSEETHGSGYKPEPALIIPQQISGDELFIKLIHVAGKKNWRVFLLGGQPGVAQQAAQKLATNYQPALSAAERLPATNIQTHPGSPDIAHETSNEKFQNIATINSFRPHLLFVAYGAPWQEKWLSANMGKLHVNLSMGIGGAIDDIAGATKSTPQIFRSLKLRWLWRLITQPTRLPRIWRALVVFPWRVITEAETIDGSTLRR